MILYKNKKLKSIFNSKNAKFGLNRFCMFINEKYTLTIIFAFIIFYMMFQNSYSSSIIICSTFTISFAN